MKTSTLYLYCITAVTVIGGLLFGYDTAVISGAEQGLEAFFRSASDFEYTKALHGITASSALIVFWVAPFPVYRLPALDAETLSGWRLCCFSFPH